jgi:hypothetical protein
MQIILSDIETQLVVEALRSDSSVEVRDAAARMVRRKRRKPRYYKQLVETAEIIYHEPGRIEVDSDATVSVSGSRKGYVSAWVWTDVD